MTVRKKLIEVVLPLDAINEASVREKSIRHGHPSTLHLWWARRPLAAARAVIFAQMVDDPSSYRDELLADPDARARGERRLREAVAAWRARRAADDSDPILDPSRADDDPEPTLDECVVFAERERLFAIMRQLVEWENTTNERVLDAARAEIRNSWRRACADNADHPRAADLFDPDRLPAFHDPFAGGGALPLEAQRLGLEAHASDLNPVAVVINKAMIEIPPKFAGRPPVHPALRADQRLIRQEWTGARGLAADVRAYGQWMRDEAAKRIGHLYPTVLVTPAMTRQRPDLKPYEGKALTVIAWLWARAVFSPNPAFRRVAVPLASSFLLSVKPGKEAYVVPVIENGGYRFEARAGRPPDYDALKAGTKLPCGANFRCLMSGQPIDGDYIKAEGRAGRLGDRLMAIVAEGDRGRVFLSPLPEHEAIARSAAPSWKPEGDVPARLTGGTCVPYGLDRWWKLFTPRQLVALNTLADLVGEARDRARQDAIAAGMPDDGRGLEQGGTGATAYADAVAVYLAFVVDRVADGGCSLNRWTTDRLNVASLFARQAIPMIWDFAESNPFCNSTRNLADAVDWVVENIEAFPARARGSCVRADAMTQQLSKAKVICTDPPYFDNIGYADLADFFYVWLRRTLGGVAPQLFATVATPKAAELVATPYRHGGREKATAFFLNGMTEAMRQVASQAHPAFPVTLFYAFKQSEDRSDEGVASTGWETFLSAVLHAGLAVTGTWPMRTELGNRMISLGNNALASSIVLVCRPRSETAPTLSRGRFAQRLRTELRAALGPMLQANMAPVDLAQAAIGPGMAVYSQLARVRNADDSEMTVREALALINATLDELLAEHDADYDAETRWAITWFEQRGFDPGPFGDADNLARARNTSVDRLVAAGMVKAEKGEARLVPIDMLTDNSDRQVNDQAPVWSATHALCRALRDHGENAAANLLAAIGSKAGAARDLAYRLYAICDRKKWAQHAGLYNALAQSWPNIEAARTKIAKGTQSQMDMGGADGAHQRRTGRQRA